MATIVPTAMTGYGSRAVTVTTLGASDTLTFSDAKNPVLVLDNVTAGPLTVTIDGDGATTVAVPGAGTFDISAGYSTGAIAAGAKVAIPLRSISRYLAGVIAITGGAGIEAQLLEF